MGANRDNYVDFAKGVMILSVIHIHTIYWSLRDHIPDFVRHLAYFVDVPIFFFISGYLFRQTTMGAAAWNALRQFARLYLHYAIISFLVAMAVMWGVHFSEAGPLRDVGGSLTSILTIQPSGDVWSHLRGYNGNLWFIRVYFSLLVIAPLLIGVLRVPRLWVPLLAFFFLFFVLSRYEFRKIGFLLSDWRLVSFYALFFFLGAIYRANERHFRPGAVLCSLGLNIALVLLIILDDGMALRLSRHKFPPTSQYFVCSMIVVHVFILARPLWSRMKTARFMKLSEPVCWAGRNVFVLYLLQGAICSIPYLFVESLNVENAGALYGLVFSFNAMGTAVLGFAYISAQRGLSRLMSGIRPEVAKA